MGARGFQESENPPQSDSLTTLRESSIFFAIAAQEEFHLRAMDIRAAFLQANELNREVYVVPLTDIRKEGVLWHLIKPLYGLKDVSRKCWFRLKIICKEVGLITVWMDSKAWC